MMTGGCTSCRCPMQRFSDGWRYHLTHLRRSLRTPGCRRPVSRRFAGRLGRSRTGGCTSYRCPMQRFSGGWQCQYSHPHRNLRAPGCRRPVCRRFVGRLGRLMTGGCTNYRCPRQRFSDGWRCQSHRRHRTGPGPFSLLSCPLERSVPSPPHPATHSPSCPPAARPPGPASSRRPAWYAASLWPAPRCRLAQQCSLPLPPVGGCTPQTPSDQFRCQCWGLANQLPAPCHLPAHRYRSPNLHPGSPSRTPARTRRHPGRSHPSLCPRWP